MQGLLAACALALAVAFGTPAVQASHVPGVLLNGRVTAVTSDSVSLDGHRYRVQVGSPAAQALAKLKLGQTVTLGLSGAPENSSSQVVVIQAPTGQQ